jgi:hypothetical protein
VFRGINGVMAALFLFAVVVQYNDPDPVRWMAIYGAACVVAVSAAIRGRAPRWLAAIVGIVALAWALDWAFGVSSLGLYAHMFDAWEMKSVPIEEAREASGLLIVAVWMTALVFHARSARR